MKRTTLDAMIDLGDAIDNLIAVMRSEIEPYLEKLVDFLARLIK